MSENIHHLSGNLLVGSSHFFVDTTNNRVGITTADPDAGLHVNSNAYVHTDFRVGSGIAMNVTGGRITAGSFEGDGSLLSGVNSDSGSWVNGTNSNVHLATSTDNVGIGIDNPGHKLDVNGDINISSGTLKVGGTPAVFSNWSVDGSDIYRPSGNVGVGTNAPVAKLNIQGTSKGAPPTSGSDGTSNGIFRLRDNFNVTLDIGTLGASPWTTWLQVADSNGMGVEYPLALQPNGGNVGIGTSSPSAKLDVRGNIIGEGIAYNHKFYGGFSGNSSNSSTTYTDAASITYTPLDRDGAGFYIVCEAWFDWGAAGYFTDDFRVAIRNSGNTELDYMTPKFINQGGGGARYGHRNLLGYVTVNPGNANTQTFKLSHKRSSGDDANYVFRATLKFKVYQILI